MTNVTALAVVLPERCYRCGVVTFPLAGLLLDGDSTESHVFREFDDIAATVARHVPIAELMRLRIGAIKHRRSRQRGVYLSNGCWACDTILGSFPLHDALGEFLSEGGSLHELVSAAWQLPAVRCRAWAD